ncbi:MAG: RNA polymerase sigma factor [Planctomycetota bacterium]
MNSDEGVADLVGLALAGDRRAFAALVERHSRLAAGVAYGILREEHLAADAVQEAFLKAYQGLGRLTQHDSFASWFVSIVRSTATDFVRRKARFAMHEVPLVDEASMQHGAGRGGVGAPRVATPPESMQQAEEAAQLRKALNDLPEEYREVILLKHLEGRSYRDIARLLKTSVRAVESRLFRARQLLSTRLEIKRHMNGHPYPRIEREKSKEVRP